MELKAEEEEVGGVQPVSIQAFASSSTLHGLAHIFSYERLSLKRALWALCFLGSLAVLLCVCTERVQYYFHYHHVTKLDEVAASQLTFPAVTLCNLNEFRFSQVSKNDLYHAGELLALLNNRYEIPDTQMADEKQLEILQDKANFRSFKPKPFNMREFYDRAGHDIRDMLLSCHFRGEVCSAEDFKVWEQRCDWNAEQHQGEGAGRWLPSLPYASPLPPAETQRLCRSGAEVGSRNAVRTLKED
ncbi:Acid-sensing ion channel 1 [Sciurus carolinensis]|uniref:Acid-sensing ion channel 1 n=1 Tax=Sciurus carolinensis TaxID=30640 RepID=A0AA41MVS4_SCICA|nr:Acid-sensing ion channel 1 [Sciurus carolinensis]